MRFSIHFVLYIARVIAFDSLFFDDQPPLNLNLDRGTDPISDSIFGISSTGLYHFDTNGSSEEGVISDDDNSWNMLFDGSQVFPEPLADATGDCSHEFEAAGKRRKSRSTECKVEGPTVDLPPNFEDLDIDIQQKLYRDLVCPSLAPGVALVPVCSSRISSNNHFAEQISDPGVWSYTLMDSLICTLMHRCGLSAPNGFCIVMWNDVGYCSSPREPFCCKTWVLYTFFRDDGSWFKIVSIPSRLMMSDLA